MCGWKRLQRRVGLACLLALSACATGIAPATPRVARGAGYELELGTLHEGLGLKVEDDRQLEVRVRAVPRRTRVLTASVQASAQPPCSGGILATNVHVPAGAWTNRRRPRPGETLVIDLPGAAWTLATAGPSRLDVLLRDGDGALQCASFPLVDGSPEHRWKLLNTWNVTGTMQYDVFLDHVSGVESAAAFALSLGKWLGMVRVSAGAGGGISWCTRAPCVNDIGESPQTYYLPVFAGADTPVFQIGRFAFELAAQYKAAWTEARKNTGERQPLFLHGPELIPRLAWTLPDPLAPGIPGGPRRGYTMSFAVPVGYVMSTRGDASLSVGGGILFSFPTR
jgi:hypothetical protein